MSFLLYAAFIKENRHQVVYNLQQDDFVHKAWITILIQCEVNNTDMSLLERMTVSEVIGLKHYKSTNCLFFYFFYFKFNLMQTKLYCSWCDKMQTMTMTMIVNKKLYYSGCNDLWINVTLNISEYIYQIEAYNSGGSTSSSWVSGRTGAGRM